MDPAMVLNAYSSHLTPYELNEIEKYNEIYYFGENIVKINGTSEKDYVDER